MANYIELSKRFSKYWQPKWQSLYDKVHTTQNCKHLNWKYVLEPDKVKSDYLNEFSWLNNVLSYDINKDAIVFFKTNGAEKPNVKPHIDPGAMYWSLVFPVYNCTKDVITSWVEPIEDINASHAEYKNGYDTAVLNLRSEYKVTESYAIREKAILFKGNQWHMVTSLHNRNETRVIAKIWSENYTLDYLKDVCRDVL